MAFSKSKTLLMLLFISLAAGTGLAGCGNDNDAVAESGSAPKVEAKKIPPLMQDLEDLLAQPYSAHFSNSQGDFAKAIQIGSKVQGILENADSRTIKNVMGLVDRAHQLEDYPTEGNYKALVDEWNLVKGSITLRE